MPRILSVALLTILLYLSGSTASTGPVQPALLRSITGLQWTTVNPMNGHTSFDTHCTAGYINAKEHYWITAAHCVVGVTGQDDHGDAIVEILPADYSLAGSPAIVVMVDVDNDIAIMQTIINDHGKQPLKLAKTQPIWTSRVSMVGYPFGQGPIYAEGYVSNPFFKFVNSPGWEHRAFMLYNMAGCPGNSGSPVVNAKGEMVSLLQIGWGSGCAPIMGGTTLTTLRTVAGAYFG